jgi:hypothetical protein
LLAGTLSVLIVAGVFGLALEVPDCCAHLGSCDQQVPMPALY